MQEKKENKKSAWKWFLIIKNYIFMWLWITYFWYYFSPKYQILLNYIKENVLYWVEILEYSNAIMAFLLVVGLIWIINRNLKRISLKIAEKTNNKVDNFFVEHLFWFIKTNKYFIGLYVFFQFITLSKEYSKYVDNFFYIIFLIIFIYFLTSFINVSFETLLLKRTRFKSLNKNLLTFIKKTIIVATWIIWVITVLSNLWYNVTALITGAWIGWLAIALAAQKTLSNMFGAITVLLTKPFKLGDFVKIDWQVGTIKEMWLSHLTMVDKEWYYVLIPNEKLISSNIENLSKRETRRCDLFVGLEYSTSLEKLKQAVKIIEDIIQEYVEKETIESFRVNFDKFDDYSLKINIVYFSLLNDVYLEFVKQKEQINLEIKEKFEKENIKIAFPTQEIIMKNS